MYVLCMHLCMLCNICINMYITSLKRVESDELTTIGSKRSIYIYMKRNGLAVDAVNTTAN